MSHRFATLILVFLLTFSGSALAGENTRQHARLAEGLKQIKTVLIVPDVRLFEVTAGGAREPRDEWSRKSREFLVENMTEILKARGLAGVDIGAEQAKEDAFREVRLLYDAVAYSIRIHTYGQWNLFPEKVGKFEYSVGPVEAILESRGADALLFLDAGDNFSTGGRKAMMVAAVITGAITGIVPVSRTGGPYAFAALVDRAGDVLWFNSKVAGRDLREAEGAAAAAQDLFADFPGTSP
jgi:hypothetical protein